jgi:hypothetical protein
MGSWEHHSKGKDDSHKVAVAAIIGIVAVLFLPMIIHTVIMILMGITAMFAGVGIAAAGKFYLNHRASTPITTNRTATYKELLAAREDNNGSIAACPTCNGHIHSATTNVEAGRRNRRITRGEYEAYDSE